MCTEKKTITKKSETNENEEEEEKKEEEVEEEERWLYTQKHVLPVHRFPEKIYRSEAQMRSAVRSNSFHINNTMALKNGRLYFLCYE